MSTLVFEISPKDQLKLDKRFKLEVGKNPEEMVEVRISSRGIETKTKVVEGRKRKYLYGSVTSGEKVTKFEIQCDAPIQIPFFLAEFLRYYIER